MPEQGKNKHRETAPIPVVHNHQPIRCWTDNGGTCIQSGPSTTRTLSYMCVNSMISIHSQPRTRNVFRLAIICALPLEAGMVRAVFDDVWSDAGSDFDFSQAEEDRNAYTIGRIGKHNVVLVHMAGMGAIDATTAVTGLRTTFPYIDIVFVVGICGASPTNITTQEEICLGDCILSKAVVQYDFGRQYPGHFDRKTDVEDSLGRAKPEIRALLSRLQTPGTPQALEGRIAQHLQVLQKKEPKAHYPGSHKDRLFDPDYLHIHRDNIAKCNKCVDGSEVCTKDCSEIGCDEAGLRPRTTLAIYENTPDQRSPRLHFGRYGSANTVLKSGTDRDKYIEANKIIAFEMEAAGIWESLPTLVVKSACDYADSHKNKQWQNYAAATAAAGLKSILEYWRVVDTSNRSGQAVQAAITSYSISDSVHEADKLIRNYYQSGDRLLIKRLSGQELELEKCYINLSLIDRSRGNSKEGQMSFALEARLRLDASEVGQSIPLENLFKSRELGNSKIVDPRRIFIQGRAGVGKTTLCKKIVYEFLGGRLGADLFDRLLWVPLRGLKPSQEYGWHELLKDIFRMSSTWKEVKQVYGQQFESDVFLRRTLFLFDGLDEISHQWNDEDPFYYFLSTIIRGVPNIIITSRPQANAFSLESFDLDLETVGFTVDQVSMYIKNCIKDASTVTKMERLIAHKPLVRGLLRIPVQLDAFCYTWYEEPTSEVALPGTITQDTSDISNTSNPITMTTLYQSITTELCRKDLRLLGRLHQGERLSSSEIQNEFQGELALLEEIAFYGLFDNVVEFNPQHWDRLGGYLYTSNTEFSAIFKSTLDRLSFLRTSDYDSDYTKRTYHFIHLTYQEFFAARYFVECWQHSKPLTSLRLTGRGEPDKKTPLVLLREEKYNPRYNIFWRFVSGLMSEKNRTAELFRQLHAEPIDLIGATHRRLLMYCLSEVIPNRNQELYNEEVDLLKQRLTAESKVTKEARRMLYDDRPEDIQLGTEAEFPEEILRDCLQNEFVLPYERTLATIGHRSVVQLETLKTVADKLASNFPMLIRSQAAGILFRNSTICPQPLLEDAITVCITALNNETSNVQKAALSALRALSPLPERVIDALITGLFEDEASSVQSDIMRSLMSQPSLEAILNSMIVALQSKDDKFDRYWFASTLGRHSLSKEGVNILSEALEDEKSCVRHFAAYFLTRQSLPKETIGSLIAILQNKDERSNVRSSAIRALEEYSLPEEAIKTLLEMIQDEEKGFSMWLSAADTLKKHSLSEEAIDTLLAIFQDKDRTSGVRRCATVSLRGRSLPKRAVNTLILALEDEDNDVGLWAAIALGEGSYLSEEAIDSLVTLLKNKFPRVREFAARALRSQSNLSGSTINALLAVLKDEVSDVRKHAAYTLEKQLSVSQETVNALVAVLQTKDDSSFTGCPVVETLGKQPYLSEEAIKALVKTLKHKDSTVRSYTVRALQEHSPLTSEAVMILVEMLREDNFEIYEILHHQKSFFHMVGDLDNRAWLNVWSAWCRRGLRNDVSCYELQGSLYLWSGGIRHEILTDSARIYQLRKAVFSKSNIVSKEDVASKPCIRVMQDDVLTKESDIAPKSKSRACYRLLCWRN